MITVNETGIQSFVWIEPKIDFVHNLYFKTVSVTEIKIKFVKNY